MEGKDFTNVSTKVSAAAYAQLKKLCKKKGISTYEMLQMVCDTLIRYMSSSTNLTPEIEQAMSIFEHMDGWKSAFNLADHTTEIEVDEAVYFIGDPNKKGTRAVFVHRPFMGNWTQTVNVQDILEKVLCKMMPERYRRLRLIANDMGVTSMLEAIDKLIDEASEEESLRQLRQGFEDADRSDAGRKPVDAPYRRKMHKDVDAPDIQQTIEFSEEENDKWFEENRPFGYEHL